VSRGQAASGLALSPTLRLRRRGGGWSMLRHVGADLHDDRILLEQVLLEPVAFVQHGLGIEQRLLRPCVAGLAEHVLPHQDDEHEDELRHTRQEEQKRERIGVKAEQAEEGQRHPAELDDGGQVERPHRTHAMRDERRDRAIQADVLVLDAAWPDRFAGFDPGVRLGLDQGDALGQHQILLPQMVVELTDRAQDGLRIVIRLGRPEVGAAAQHPLPDEDDEDKQELDDVAEEEQKREGIGIGRAQGAEARQSDPPADEDQGEIHGPHGARFFSHPHGERVVDTAVRGGLQWGARGHRGFWRGAWKGSTQSHRVPHEGDTSRTIEDARARLDHTATNVTYALSNVTPILCQSLPSDLGGQRVMRLCCGGGTGLAERGRTRCGAGGTLRGILHDS